MEQVPAVDRMYPRWIDLLACQCLFQSRYEALCHGLRPYGTDFFKFDFLRWFLCCISLVMAVHEGFYCSQVGSEMHVFRFLAALLQTLIVAFTGERRQPPPIRIVAVMFFNRTENRIPVCVDFPVYSIELR